VIGKTLKAGAFEAKTPQMPIFDNHTIRYTPDKKLNAS